MHQFNLHENNHCLDKEKCITLSHSPLCIYCEVLTIMVKNRETIIELIQNMLNLRTLIINCADDMYNQKSALTLNSNDVLQWLKDHLPSAYSTVRNSENDNTLNIWI